MVMKIDVASVLLLTCGLSLMTIPEQENHHSKKEILSVNKT